MQQARTIFDPFNAHPPTPPPNSMDDAEEIALARASFLSKLTFWWIQPLLVLGYKRTLVAEDLPRMDHSRQAAVMADQFEQNFERRRREIQAWNSSIDDGTMRPSTLRKAWWKVWHKATGFGAPDGKRKVGLALALSDTFFWQFWTAGLFKVVGDAASVCSPLVVKQVSNAGPRRSCISLTLAQIIYYVTDAHNPLKEPSVGKGIGLAFGLWGLQILFS